MTNSLLLCGAAVGMTCLNLATQVAYAMVQGKVLASDSSRPHAISGP